MSKVFSKTYKLIMVVFLLPLVSFAQVDNTLCSKSGYTIETINGIFTDEARASDNKTELQKYFPSIYHNEPLTIDFLLNKTHKILDITDTAIQKTFEGVDMWDPDFIKMLNDASTQVKTQKVLLVAHSQGNFYANNVYKVVTDDGDVSKKSIGVYGVASPASYVAGDGRHLTSSTDKVIAFLVENVLPGSIAPTNDTIDYKWADDPMGHDFAKVYLEYRPKRIVDDIKWSLDKLSADPARSENTPCINPPKELSTVVKIISPVVYTGKSALIITIAGATITKNTAVGTAVGTYNVAVNTAVWTYNTSVAVAVWSYNTTVAVGKAVGNAAIAAGSAVYNTVATGASATYNILAEAFLPSSFAGNNSAAVILAVQPQTQSAQSSLSANAITNKNISVTPTQPTTSQTPVIVPPQPQTILVFEPKVQTGTNAPKLVFVGSFNYGSGSTASPSTQVLGTQSTVVVVDEATTDGEVIGVDSGVALDAPTLSAPQCAQTLATDGCLLATTTVRFEWSPIAGVDHYVINQNGVYATTTDTALDLTIKDFSDYTLEVWAVDANGRPSATSTQNVSVATIPLAINEIAWMGTVASATDEWFEIKNNTNHTIDLSQWALNAKDGTPNIAMKGTINPHAYIIFERTNDETVKDVLAHATTTGALNNGGEQLTLSRDSVIFDQTPDGAWVAGYNSTTSRQTMERYSSREDGSNPENWGTNLGYIKNGTDAEGNPIEGTPGAQNSVSTLINKGSDITSDLTLTNDEERYVVPNQLWVDTSSTLVIEPGVTISFLNDSQEHYGYFIVNGAVDARGTLENPITFNSFSKKRAGDFWIDNATGTSTFDHARFENMNNVFTVSAGTLEISDSEFVNTDGGVSAYGKNSRVFIENTRFASSTDDTIGVYNGGVVSIASSTIENQIDDDAIGVYYSSLIMSSTTIDGVHDGNGIGAYYSLVSIASSTVSNTESDAMRLSNSTTTIANTLVQGGPLNDWAYGINISGGTATVASSTVSGFVDGSGIAVSLNREDYPTYKIIPGLVADISNTEITGNAVGIEMEADSTEIAPDVSMHDNGEDIVVW